MTNFKGLLLISLVVAFSVGSACTPKAEEQAKAVSADVKDKAAEIAEEAKDKTKEIAGEVAEKGKEVLSATGEAITDGWVLAKLKTKFSDDKLVKEGKIDVDVKDRVVTLKGTVPSAEAKAQAATIARGTEGVGRVVDELIVKVDY
jgi:hyperosmotically inducible protein